MACCSSIWACSCKGSCCGLVCAEHRPCWGWPAQISDVSCKYRPGHRCEVLGYEQKDLLVREFFWLKYTRTSIQSWLTQVPASSCAITQLNFSLKFQIGRGKKWLSKSCRFFFFPKMSSTLFNILWFYIAKRTTLAKTSTFDSFYSDVDVVFIFLSLERCQILSFGFFQMFKLQLLESAGCLKWTWGGSRVWVLLGKKQKNCLESSFKPLVFWHNIDEHIYIDHSDTV